MFNPGDTVKCIRESTDDYFGKVGKIYTVSSYNITSLYLKEDADLKDNNPNRFVKIPKTEHKPHYKKKIA